MNAHQEITEESLINKFNNNNDTRSAFLQANKNNQNNAILNQLNKKNQNSSNSISKQNSRSNSISNNSQKPKVFDTEKASNNNINNNINYSNESSDNNSYSDSKSNNNYNQNSSYTNNNRENEFPSNMQHDSNFFQSQEHTKQVNNSSLNIDKKRQSNFSFNEKVSIDFGLPYFEQQLHLQDNTVTSTKYNFVTFLPKSLFLQFKRASNIYFLIISILTLMDFTPKEPTSMVGTFAFVLIATMIKEFIEDYSRYQQDCISNNRLVQRLGHNGFENTQCKNLRPGNIVKIYKEEEFSADILIFSSTNSNGYCYIDTKNLDGESNLKEKSIVTLDYNPDNLRVFEGKIKCDKENEYLNKYEGTISLGSDQTASQYINIKNLILKGSTLKNTDVALGIVIYTGKNTKISKNFKSPVQKVSKILKIMNRLLYSIFTFQIIMCLLFAVLSTKFKINSGEDRDYIFAVLKDDSDFFYFFIRFLIFIVAYSNLIPISLYVALEIVKLFQGLLIFYDNEIYDILINKPSRCRSSDLVEELGQVEFIFSDKTGTLTQNVMILKKCMIGSMEFGGSWKRNSKSKLSSNTNKRFHTANSKLSDPRSEKIQEIIENNYVNSQNNSEGKDSKNSKASRKSGKSGKSGKSYRSGKSGRSVPKRRIFNYNNKENQNTGTNATQPPSEINKTPTNYNYNVYNEKKYDQILEEIQNEENIPHPNTIINTNNVNIHNINNIHINSNIGIEDLNNLNNNINNINSINQINNINNINTINTINNINKLNINKANHNPNTLNPPQSFYNSDKVRKSLQMESVPMSLKKLSNYNLIKLQNNNNNNNNYNISDMNQKYNNSSNYNLNHHTNFKTKPQNLNTNTNNLHSPSNGNKGIKTNNFINNNSNSNHNNNNNSNSNKASLEFKQSNPSKNSNLKRSATHHSNAISNTSKKLSVKNNLIEKFKQTLSQSKSAHTNKNSFYQKQEYSDNEADDFAHFDQKNTIYGDTSAYEKYISLNTHEDEKAQIETYFLILALCHAVFPETTDKGILYQGSSPDDIALVKGAHQFGFSYISKNHNIFSIRNDITGKVHKFEQIVEMPFDSDRKRMSVIVKDLESSVIRIFTKGADSVMDSLIDWSDIDEEEDNFGVGDFYAAINRISQEGLRCLVIAQSVLDEEDVNTWLSDYLMAKTRGKELSSYYEAIECNLTYVGITGIEDKLQEGVGNTLNSLINCNIRVWVLTGDKEDTAVEIGRSCKLIQEKMNIIKITSSSIQEKGSLKDLIIEYIKTLNLNSDKYLGEDYITQINDEDEKKEDEEKLKTKPPPHLNIDQIREHLKHHFGADTCLVIDGQALEEVFLSYSISTAFFALACGCISVICCRMSPKQKARIVKLVKVHGEFVTLSIGDGSNDVPMLMEANIGVGIIGKEGTQAVKSSDFNIGRFRFLEKLLLVYGRNSYVKISKFICFYFYKNILVSFTECFYAIYNGFSGQIYFAEYLSAMFNAFFTSWPCLLIFAFEREHNLVIARQFPVLYQAGHLNYYFNLKELWINIFSSIVHSVFCFFFPFYVLNFSPNNNSIGNFGLWNISTISFTLVIQVCSFKLLIMSYFWNWITFLSIVLAILVYYISIFVLSSNSMVFLQPELLGIAEKVFSVNYNFLVVLLGTIMCLLPDYILKQWFYYTNPNPSEYLMIHMKDVERFSSVFPSNNLKNINNSSSLSRNSKGKRVRLSLEAKQLEPTLKEFSETISINKSNNKSNEHGQSIVESKRVNKSLNTDKSYKSKIDNKINHNNNSSSHHHVDLINNNSVNHHIEHVGHYPRIEAMNSKHQKQNSMNYNANNNINYNNNSSQVNAKTSPNKDLKCHPNSQVVFSPENNKQGNLNSSENQYFKASISTENDVNMNINQALKVKNNNILDKLVYNNNNNVKVNTVKDNNLSSSLSEKSEEDSFKIKIIATEESKSNTNTINNTNNNTNTIKASINKGKQSGNNNIYSTSNVNNINQSSDFSSLNDIRIKKTDMNNNNLNLNIISNEPSSFRRGRKESNECSDDIKLKNSNTDNKLKDYQENQTEKIIVSSISSSQIDDEYEIKNQEQLNKDVDNGNDHENNNNNEIDDIDDISYTNPHNNSSNIKNNNSISKNTNSVNHAFTLKNLNNFTSYKIHEKNGDESSLRIERSEDKKEDNTNQNDKEIDNNKERSEGIDTLDQKDRDRIKKMQSSIMEIEGKSDDYSFKKISKNARMSVTTNDNIKNNNANNTNKVFDMINTNSQS